jgi:hypothetical protein
LHIFRLSVFYVSALILANSLLFGKNQRMDEMENDVYRILPKACYCFKNALLKRENRKNDE